MKKGLPKFVLVTDPYNGLEGRTIIFKTQFPKYIYELNRSDDENAQLINILGEEYSVVVRKDIDNQNEIKLSELNEVVRWYHFSKIVSKESKRDI